MNLSNIHVQGAELVRVLEDLEQAKLKLVFMFVGDSSQKKAGGLLVFDGVTRYRIFEERDTGCPTILGLSAVEVSDGSHSVRLDTSRGYREIHCTTVSNCSGEAAA